MDERCIFTEIWFASGVSWLILWISNLCTGFYNCNIMALAMEFSSTAQSCQTRTNYQNLHADTSGTISNANTGHDGMQCSQCVHLGSSTMANKSSRTKASTGHRAIQAPHHSTDHRQRRRHGLGPLPWFFGSSWGFQYTHPLISTGTHLLRGKDIKNAVFLQNDIAVQAKVDWSV